MKKYLFLLILFFVHLIVIGQGNHYLQLSSGTACQPGTTCQENYCPGEIHGYDIFTPTACEVDRVILQYSNGRATERFTESYFTIQLNAQDFAQGAITLTIDVFYEGTECGSSSYSYYVHVSNSDVLPVVANGSISGPLTAYRGEIKSYYLNGTPQNVEFYNWTIDDNYNVMNTDQNGQISFAQVSLGSHTLKCTPVNKCGTTNGVFTYPITILQTCNTDGAISVEGNGAILAGETRRVYLSSVSNPDDYSWTLASGLQNLGVNSSGGINVKFTGTGSYEVKATPSNSCSPITKTVSVGQLCVSKTEFSSEIILLPAPPNQTLIIEPGCSQTYTSTTSVILRPGLEIREGGELIIHVDQTPPSMPDNDLDKNWVIDRAYDSNGNVIGESKQFFDKMGRPTQSQIKNIANGHVLAAQTVYDEFGNGVLSTLSAPIFNKEFNYKENFIINPSGQEYSYSDFDLSTQVGTPGEVNNPKPVGVGDVGSLGWYYSNKNNLEPYTDITQYPYTRSWVEKSPDPSISKVSAPGDQFKMGSGKEAETVKERISDDPILNHYCALREYYVPGSSTLENKKEGYKILSNDANDKKSISYVNAAGETIIAGVNNENGYDYSYAFFNDAGNLIAEVAPMGVNLASFERPSGFVTTYSYNQLGWLLSTTAPDEGRSEFVYSDDGKIRFSQNELQRTANPARFSYTNYDDSDRPLESGEYVMSGTGYFEFQNHSTNTVSANSILNIVNGRGNEGALDQGRCRDISRITYDLQSNNYPANVEHLQQNFLEGEASKTTNENATTWYSYDQFGRLEWSQQDIVGLGLKTIKYTYDFTGNILEVAYQQGKPDAFYHHYEYDEDQNLKTVYTSKDRVNKALQATYSYYLHGPLKRVELGNKLQGIDYVYNVQGLLKSINHPEAAKDPGKDGTNGFAEDAFAFSLDYYNGDYLKEGTGITGVDPGTDYAPQYNGNIRAMSWKTKKPGSVIGSEPQIENPTTYAFKYDSKYQLKEATWGTPDFLNRQFSSENRFKEYGLNYDSHGNIINLKRNGNSGGATPIDNFVYNYIPSSNKLENIDGYSSYKYDAVGQMIEETKGGVTTYLSYDASGNVTGLYSDISRTQPKVTFSYDEGGQRIKKVSYNTTPSITTYYVRDVSGNVMATYDNNNSPQSVKEFPIYAGGRIGQYDVSKNIIIYELTDHLGNVRSLIKGEKLADGTIDVIDYNDYYPFGSIARRTNTSHYKYGYQGQYAEQDEETGWNSFELRMYDAKIGRWLSIDPYGESFSPYQAMGNNPVNNVDPDGGCWSCIVSIINAWLSNGFPLATVNVTANSAIGGVATSVIAGGVTSSITAYNPEGFLGSVSISNYNSFKTGTDDLYNLPKLESRSAQTSGGVNGFSIPKIEAAGEWESLIPIWGSSKNAIHAFQSGNYWTGAFYTAMAVSDVFLVKSVFVGIGRAVVNVGLKNGVKKYFGMGMSHSYSATVSRLKNIGVDMSGFKHHWLISQKMMEGRPLLQAIGNQTWNLKRFATQASHMRWAHGHIYMGKGYSFWKYVYPITSTPTWFKAAVVSGGLRL